MASLSFYNSLTQKEEAFSTQNKEVLFYTCGPTIYNTPHIGNYRAYVFADILRRTLELNDYKVKHIINLTDVDDKTIKKSIELGIPLNTFTEKYELEFYEHRKELLLLEPYKYPRATNSIPEMIKIIEVLINKNVAYIDENGNVYFSVEKDPNYGQLVKIDKDKLMQNASGRLDDEYDQENIQDFALWKAWDENDGDNFWQSPWGKGRPGWHIECSAMAKEFLGETIDIHTGGVDNMFPHHENEIAQSECATDVKFSRFFLHCQHLLIDSKKMAKRDGNFLSLSDLKDKEISPLSYKYFLYGTNYRSPANLTFDALEASQNTLKRLYEKYIQLIDENFTHVQEIIEQNDYKNLYNKYYVENLKDALNSDLNTSISLSILNKIFDDEKLEAKEKIATILKFDMTLGLGFIDYTSQYSALPQEIEELILQREKARSEKDFTNSDSLRTIINTKGFVVIDLKDKSIVARDPFYTNPN